MRNIDQITKEVEKRWPQISVAIDPEAAIEFLGNWSELNEPSGKSLERMQEAFHGYLSDRLKEVCVSELIDALAENLSCLMLEQFIKQLQKSKGGEDAKK